VLKVDELARGLGMDASEVYRRVIGDDHPVPPALPNETGECPRICVGMSE
jgi:hypothetical protein